MCAPSFCVHSSHDLCVCAHAHSLERTLVATKLRACHFLMKWFCKLNVIRVTQLATTLCLDELRAAEAPIAL